MTDTNALAVLVRYHETGGLEGDCSDITLAMAKEELTALRATDEHPSAEDYRNRAERAEQALAEQQAEIVRFYIDCEFDGHNGPLLSMALVRDDGDGIHIKTTAPVADEWVRANVLPLMDKHDAPKSASVGPNDVGLAIRAFIGDCDCPVIVADSPVDIGRFCRALSTGRDGGWASANYPAMRFEVHNVDCYPTALPGAVQHNAWWDAMALRHKLTGDYKTGGSDAE